MSFLDVLLPPACVGCGRVGAVLCERCIVAFRPPSSARDRFLVADAGVVLGVALRLGLAAFAYEGVLRRALAALKYSGAARVAVPVADGALPTFSALVAVAGSATLVPVPLHEERRRVRGYNQAELLGARLARSSGLPMRSVLERIRPTVKQHELNREARLANLRGAFAVRGPVPSTAIVVDDIVTTVATLEACAVVLREAGCDAVYGFSIARDV